VGSVSRRWRSVAVWLVFLALLAALTVWNVTSSTGLAEARVAYARGALANCLEHALNHLARQPWSREAALLAARSFSRLDYAEQAEKYFKRAGRLSQSDLQMRAYGLARSRHPEAAIPVFNEILVRDPENVAALRRLAAVLLSQFKTDELLSLADRLSRIPTGAVIGAAMRAVVHHNDTNPQAAVAAFEQVLALDPNLQDSPLPRRLFWEHFADDLVASGRITDAKAYLTKAILAASDPALMNLLGNLYVLDGNIDQAERCFNQAVEGDPNQYGPHLGLAKLALQRRQPRDALGHLKKAKLLAPRQYDVLYTLASVYRQLGQIADAERTQESVKQLRASPDLPQLPLGGAWPRYAL
jgi:tetratricopeptide (TPR) repeat protein